MKLPKLLELIIALGIVTVIGACATHHRPVVCVMPVAEPTAGTEWCEHQGRDCCVAHDNEPDSSRNK